MRSRFRRRKVLRRAGIATMLAAAGLVISGCDFTNVRDNPPYKDVAIKRSASDQLIFHCTGRQQSTGQPRSTCVLDAIGAFCNKWEQPGFTNVDCALVANWRPSHPYRLLDVEYAIQAVTGPFADCLAVHYDTRDPYGSADWHGASGGFCDNSYP
jgi:hypothetical protein